MMHRSEKQSALCGLFFIGVDFMGIVFVLMS